MTSATYIPKSLISEFVSTLVLMSVILLICIQLPATPGSVPIAAAMIGAAVTFIVYNFGKYSGAHANPAVTASFMASGQMSPILGIGYILTQLLAAACAVYVIHFFFGADKTIEDNEGDLAPEHKWKAVAMSALVTGTVCFSYLTMYADANNRVQGGLVIGLTAALTFWFSYNGIGGSANPAHSTAVGMFKGPNHKANYWVFILGPLIGALGAAALHRLMNARPDVHMRLGPDGKPELDKSGKPVYYESVPIRDAEGNHRMDECGRPLTAEKLFTQKPRGHHQAGTGNDGYVDVGSTFSLLRGCRNGATAAGPGAASPPRTARASPRTSPRGSARPGSARPASPTNSRRSAGSQLFN